MRRLLCFSLVVVLATPVFAQTSRSRIDLMARMDQADANGDGDVTRAELIAWRTANFTRFDRNGDGVLSDSDIPRFMRGTSIGAQFEELKVQFDTNRDGRVTRDEFIGAPTVLFDAADVNRDSVLTRAERNAALAAARVARS